ncbi:MAG: BsuBI/PstI family type II restriction endonuclease, partial [candidate division Zixibacteria bacterium]|nr:BsuBI/PstI family type II restriction endonuclease [candidate division Zixibacteria bacterium]
MTKIEEAQDILKSLGLPPAQQNDISALTLLALCGVGPKDSWSSATRTSLTITKGIMSFIETKFKRTYAPNTRETFRRQVLHQFVQAQLVDYNPDDPSMPTNSPRAHYAISKAALSAIRTYGSAKWTKAAAKFVFDQGSLFESYRVTRTTRGVPVTLPDGNMVMLSPGKHNALQAGIIKEFAPRFVPGAKVIYLGDTEKKNLVVDQKLAAKLHIPITEHDKLPDVMLYDAKQERLVLVEAVTSHGPMTPTRVYELRLMLLGCPVRPIFVTAFPDFAEYRKNIKDIAWETEV